MDKVSITLELDKQGAIRAIKATDIYLAVYEYAQELRNYCKYDEGDTTEAEKWRDKLYEILEMRSIDIEEELP